MIITKNLHLPTTLFHQRMLNWDFSPVAGSRAKPNMQSYYLLLFGDDCRRSHTDNFTHQTLPRSLVLLCTNCGLCQVGLNTKNTHDRIHSETVAFSKQKMKRLTLSSKPSVSSSWHDPGFSQNCTTQTRAGNKKV